MSFRLKVAFSIVWITLALATLYLVIKNNSALVAALVAWTSGLLTYIILENLYARYRLKRARRKDTR